VPLEHDVVLYGATGFVGELTAAYLTEHAGGRWAIAGRNAAKLAALRDRLDIDVPIVVADADDPGSLRRLAESARVVATTVGPYALHGEPMVAACAETGTDYVDLTGEPEFVDRVYVRYHATAERTGARLVHACGFDSIPHDLGAQFTVGQLPSDGPISMRGYVRTNATVSGGTFASFVTGLSRARPTLSAQRERAAVEPPASGRRTFGGAGRAGYDRTIGAWVLPFPSIDSKIIERSARALPEYGPDFTYRHYLALRNAMAGGAVVAGVGGIFLLAQLPPTRRLLLRSRPSGTGPDEQRRARSWFNVRFVATAGDERVVTEVAGGDPGYGETAKMFAESALCLARDELPATAGQVTTAVAMGATLRARLQRAGISFEVRSPAAT
jgi:short subunit dehydrogenase-like uncharacterized protein